MSRSDFPCAVIRGRTRKKRVRRVWVLLGDFWSGLVGVRVGIFGGVPVLWLWRVGLVGFLCACSRWCTGSHGSARLLVRLQALCGMVCGCFARGARLFCVFFVGVFGPVLGDAVGCVCGVFLGDVTKIFLKKKAEHAVQQDRSPRQP